MWWRVTRHFAVGGWLPAGGRHLEANVLGEWRPVRAQWDLLVLAFTRAEAEVTERAELWALQEALRSEAPAEERTRRSCGERRGRRRTRRPRRGGTCCRWAAGWDGGRGRR